MTAPYVAMKKLTGNGIIRTAARHNLRELQVELGADSHIDAMRIGSNIILTGPPSAAEVVALSEQLMVEAGAQIKRKDAVRGIEIVFSLPPVTQIDPDAYFAEALAWASRYFSIPVLSAVIHKDEAAPHCHVLLLPLIDGRMSGSAVMGYRQHLKAMQTSFFEQVGIKYGLTRPKAAKRLNQATRLKCAALAYTAIVSDTELLMRPLVEQAILDAFGRHPEPLLEAMSIAVPRDKPSRSFVEIMTKPCKPESQGWKSSKHIGFAGEPKSIGFDRKQTEESEPYVSVGFPDSPMPDSSLTDSPMPPAPKTSAAESKYTRCNDDQPADDWDAELGEFRQSPKGRRRTTLLDVELPSRH
jgi:hypothetical protein